MSIIISHEFYLSFNIKSYRLLLERSHVDFLLLHSRFAYLRSFLRLGCRTFAVLLTFRFDQNSYIFVSDEQKRPLNFIFKCRTHSGRTKTSRYVVGMSSELVHQFSSRHDIPFVAEFAGRLHICYFRCGHLRSNNFSIF